MKSGGDCSTSTDDGEPALQILVLDLWGWIETAEKLGAAAGHKKYDKLVFLQMFLLHYLVLRERSLN